MKTIRIAGLVAALTITGGLRAGTFAIDYFTGFATPTQVVTSDQPTFAAISGDPGSGVTFTNPYLFHWLTTIENYNPFLGFGGAVEVNLPGLSNRFGLFAGANSNGSDQFMLDFYDGATLVGSNSFLLPVGAPSTPIAAAFFSTVDFDRVVLTAPNNGFMRINHDSIRFELSPNQNVPETGGAGALLAGALVLLRLAARRRTA